MANAAQKYSQALFDSVPEEKQLEEVKTDFDEVVKAVKALPVFIEFMNNPKISKGERKKTVEATFENVSPPLFNLLLILTDRHLFEEIESVYNSFLKVYNAHYNQEHAIIESVYALSDEEIQSIGKVFVKKTGFSKLLIENKVNQELIGGIRVFVGTKVYDGSVEGQLADLKNQFKERTIS
ncbi:F0F1 ATP synthase subunit delta [Salinicoccus albus]|uniref:F0F1 ATP synthase subunit delta n=1 Tax=Salinicoccus albus TaxID=418756 RepID=UPI000381B076|nr:F0F1 ATP synthase subunit delta [Salinicoccus albus]